MKRLRGMGIVLVLMICGLWKADKGADGGLVLSRELTERALRASILGKVFKAGWMPIDRALQSSAKTVNMIKLARELKRAEAAKRKREE